MLINFLDKIPKRASTEVAIAPQAKGTKLRQADGTTTATIETQIVNMTDMIQTDITGETLMIEITKAQVEIGLKSPQGIGTDFLPPEIGTNIPIAEGLMRTERDIHHITIGTGDSVGIS